MSAPDDDSLANGPTLGLGPSPEVPAKRVDWLKQQVRHSLFGGPIEARTIGRFRVLRRIGAGGMGVVLLGYDEKLDRKVAIKLIAHDDPDETDRARMLREARAMARIAHPNVARVYEVGEYDAQVFVAMEYIAGPTLAQWLEAGQRSFDEIIDVFARAGRGLAAAHAAGIVHRDFKPANVLIDEQGRPLVLDFGLARAVKADASQPPSPAALTERELATVDTRLTATGSVLGTPAYMAPEQLDGSDVDARADQFSFCLALLEALWRTPPLAGLPLHARLDDATFDRVLGEAANRDLPPWLVSLLRRGLRIAPAERFETMDALLEGLSLDRGALRRRRWLRVGAGVLVVAALGATAVGMSLANTAAEKGEEAARARSQATALAEAADASEAEAREANESARQEHLARRIAHANLLASAPRSGAEAVELAMEVIAELGIDAAPDAAIEALRNGSMNARLIATLDQGEGGSVAAAFSEDGRLLATASGPVTSSVRTWDPVDGSPRRDLISNDPFTILPRRVGVSAIGFAAEDRLLLVGGTDLAALDVDTGELRRQWSGATWQGILPEPSRTAGVNRIARAPSGGRVAVGAVRGVVTVLEPGETPTGIAVDVDVGRLAILSFVDNDRLLIGGQEGEIRLWDARSKKVTWSANAGREAGRPGSLTRYGLGEQSERLAVSIGAKVLVWDLGERRPRLAIEAGEEIVRLSVTADGRTIAAMGRRSVRLIDARRGTVEAMLEAPPGAEFEALAARGGTIATRASNGLVQTWSAEGEPRSSAFGEGGRSGTLELAPDGRRAVTAGRDGFSLWNMADGLSSRELSAVPFEPRLLRPSADGRRLLAAGPAGELALVALEGSEAPEPLDGEPTRVVRALWLADGSRLVTETRDRRISLWDVERGTRLQRVSELGWDVQALADGTGFAFVESTSRWEATTIALVDASTGERRFDFEGDGPWRPQPTRIESIDAIPRVIETELDRRRLDASSRRLSGAARATAMMTNRGDRLEVWSTHDGEHIASLGPAWAHQKFALSADGRHALLGDFDDGIKVWNVESGALAIEIEDRSVATTAELGFTPDGARVYGVADDGVLRQWAIAGDASHSSIGHLAKIEQVLFTSDGRVAATRSADGEIRVWNTETGAALGVVRRHAASMAERAGELIIAQRDGTLAIHPLSRQGLVEMVCDLDRTTPAFDIAEHCRGLATNRDARVP